MNIFVDASALVPLFRLDDPLRNKALILSEKLTGQTAMISNYIFAELVTILSQKVHKEKAIYAGEYVRKHYIILRVDDGIEDLAWKIFKQQKSKNVSFVDCTTFALYQKGMFEKAFAFDEDFKRNKVPLVG